jgi:hypothetical protein
MQQRGGKIVVFVGAFAHFCWSGAKWLTFVLIDEVSKDLPSSSHRMSE